MIYPLINFPVLFFILAGEKGRVMVTNWKFIFSGLIVIIFRPIIMISRMFHLNVHYFKFLAGAPKKL